MNQFILEACDVRDEYHWSWRLKEAPDSNSALASHEVAIDPAEECAKAFFHLYDYRNKCSNPRHLLRARAPGYEEVKSTVEAVGEWAGRVVLGKIGPIIASSTPALVRVVLPDDQVIADSLLYLPLEIAHVDGKPLASQDVTFVYEAGRAVGFRGHKDPVSNSIRMLAVFSLPTGDGLLNLHEERRQLREDIMSLTGLRKAIDLRVLQYGATVQAIKDILNEGAGWDLIHFSGHALAEGIELEKEDGTGQLVGISELVKLLRPARGRLKWVTLMSCSTGAATRAETRELLGLGEAARAATVDGEEKPERHRLISAASALVHELDVAVLAMRYPVEDDFARALSKELYELVFKKAQPLPRALQLSLSEASRGCSPICLATPVLFGDHACDLNFIVPAANPTADELTRRRALFRGFPDEPVHFAGRVAVMTRACGALAPGSDRKGVLFHGVKGIGKTDCAIELAYNFKDLDRFASFVWFQVKSQDDPPVNFASEFEKKVRGADGNALFPMSDWIEAPESDFEEGLDEFRVFLGEQETSLIFLDSLEMLLRSDGEWINPRWGKLVASLLAHEGNSRVVLTSRIVPKLSPPPGLPPRGPVEHRLLPVAMNALNAAESLVLARQSSNLGTMIQGRPGAREDEKEQDRLLVRRTLELLQGHPQMIALAEAQAADRSALAAQVEKAEGAWISGGGNFGQLSAFFSRGESSLGDDDLRRGFQNWTAGVVSSLPETSQRLFQILCSLEPDDREKSVLESNWPKVWARVSAGAGPPDLAQTLEPLVRIGLVEKGPPADEGRSAEKPISQVFAIHPGLAEFGRAAGGPMIQEAVDDTLSSYWWETHASGLARGTDEGERDVTRAGLHGPPYLMRLGEWGRASLLIDHALDCDESPATAAALLPVMTRIAEAARGSALELKAGHVLARASMATGRLAEAEKQTRDVLDLAVVQGDYFLGSRACGDLINLLATTGRPSDALDLIETKKEYTRHAGLGSWTQLADEGSKAELLRNLNQVDTALDKTVRAKCAEFQVQQARDYAESLTKAVEEKTLLNFGNSFRNPILRVRLKPDLGETASGVDANDFESEGSPGAPP